MSGIWDIRQREAYGFVYSAADVYFSAIYAICFRRTAGKCIFYAEGWNSRNSSYGCAATESYYVYPCDSDDRAGRYLIFPEVFLNFSIGCRVLIVAGGLALAGLGIIFYLLLRRQALIESVGTFFVRILRMIHCGRLADKLEKKLEVSIEKYSSLVDVIFDGKRMLWKVYYPESVTEIVADYRNTFFLCSIAWSIYESFHSY